MNVVVVKVGEGVEVVTVEITLAVTQVAMATKEVVVEKVVEEYYIKKNIADFFQSYKIYQIQALQIYIILKHNL